MRKSLYLSPRLDKDILDELDCDNIEAGDFSLEVKRLMRDGIKWRKGGDTEPIRKQPVVKEQKKEEIDFSGIQIQKKEVTEGELDDKLNNL